ncbi:MAG: deoxyribonuclease IV [Thaumarchaeota archaeon]|nr:deoxyribonuclease IV [Nitrososphaerota archaeon]MDE1866661.1 deoxyribonuclease IV [Nitrososphaerota archaeon]
MQVGMHVSISGSIDRAVDNAVAADCTAFQIFTRNPRGWLAKPLVANDITSFKEKLAASKIDRFATVAHMPYLPNLSSPEDESFARSLSSLIDEIKRCSKLGVPYIVAHLGSHKGAGDKKGIERLVKAFTKAADDTTDDITILLENTAGQKNSVGSDFDQLASILQQLKPAKRFGVCLDTCHAFAAGYDLRTEKTASDTLEKFHKSIGFEHLKILHLNDSKGEIGCNIDRHEHIGLGHIGEKGLAHVIHTINSKKIPMILETPIDERRDDVGNLKKVKELA